MNFNLGALLSTIIAFQLIFVALYLFLNKKGNRRNNSLLGILFLIFAISLLDFTIRVSGMELPIPLLHFLDDGFFLLYGPLIYFYVQGIVYRDFHFQGRDSLHLLPFLAYSGYIIYQLILVDRHAQAEVIHKVASSELPIWIYFLFSLMYVHILVYLWYSWQSLQKYQVIIKERYSSIDKINLGWLRFMVKGFAVITIVAMVHNTMPVFRSVVFQYSSLAVLLMASFFFIMRVLVKALNQPAIFSGIERKEIEKYASSYLDPDSIQKYKSQIDRMMVEEKVYLNPGITSNDLAQQLEISTKMLSQVINQGFNMNFFDYVNTHRCEEVKRILRGPDKKVTILEAMYQSGFNSKSSFNKEFKKLTGMTPSQFRKG